MNADDLIQKYIAGVISEPELGELRSLLKKDRKALASLTDELLLSDAIEKHFNPDSSPDIIALLSAELNGELSEDELREYAAARKQTDAKSILDQEKRRKGPLFF